MSTLLNDRNIIRLVKVLLIILIAFLIVSIFCVVFLTLTGSVVYGAIVDMVTNGYLILNQ